MEAVLRRRGFLRSSECPIRTAGVPIMPYSSRATGRRSLSLRRGSRSPGRGPPYARALMRGRGPAQPYRPSQSSSSMACGALLGAEYALKNGRIVLRCTRATRRSRDAHPRPRCHRPCWWSSWYGNGAAVVGARRVGVQRVDISCDRPSLCCNGVGNRADLEFPVCPLPRCLDPVRVAEGANPDAVDLAVAGDGRGPGQVAAPLGVLLRPVV